MYALTGIDWSELQDLLKHRIKTFDLASADHIEIAQQLKQKEYVFITNVSKQDVRRGIEGLLGRVESVKTDYWKVMRKEFDEKEMPIARVQVTFVDRRRVTSVKNLGLGKGLKVEAETHVLVG